MILEGVLKEGDALPSVRSVAVEFHLNPLTVLKGYQQLVEEQLVEKRRGLGMFVSVGALKALMKGERSDSSRTSGRRCTPPSNALDSRRPSCSVAVLTHRRHRCPRPQDTMTMTLVIEARGLIDRAYHSDPNSQLAAHAVAMLKCSA